MIENQGNTAADGEVDNLFIMKDKKLYEAIDSSCIQLLCTAQEAPQPDPSKKRKTTAVDASTPKRHCTSTSSDSAPVLVRILSISVILYSINL